MKTTTFILVIMVFMSSCKFKKNENHEKTDPFKGLKTDLLGLPNTSIDTLYLTKDTFRLRLVDSIDWTQGLEEGMINHYILHRIARSTPSIKRIIVEKRYPNRKHLPKWQMDLFVNEIEPIIKAFDDSLFNQISEYLVKLPNSRTGTCVLLILNTRWAMLKNGDLEKRWGESFFEILYPFCKECEEGKINDNYLKIEKLKGILNDKMSIQEKQELEKVFEYFFDKCKNQKMAAHII